jgi:type VI secretion system secreted protein Hcp
MKQRWVIAAVLVASLFIITGVVFGAVDYFLKIDDVKGESRDAKHMNEIDVLSWSWGESQATVGGRSAGGAASAARVQFRDFTFTARASSASVRLFAHLTTGKPFTKAVFTGRRAGQKAQEFYKVTFYDIIMTSRESAGTGTADQLPIDRFTFNFGKVDFWYAPTKVDGSLDAPFQAKFDLRSNTKY